MNKADKEELWRVLIGNCPANMQQEIQNMRRTFMMLAPGFVVHDSGCLVERQMRVVELEIKNLWSVVDRFTPIAKRLMDVDEGTKNEPNKTGPT